MQTSAISSYELLDPLQCRERYLNSFEMLQNLVVVVSNTNSWDIHSHGSAQYANTSFIWGQEALPPGWLWSRAQDWICFAQWTNDNINGKQKPWCAVTKLDPWLMSWGDPSDSSETNYQPVSHCLSEGAPSLSGCEVQFNVVILLIVCIMTAIKVFCISMLFFRHTKGTVVILGDAIQ